ncbi:MAG: hypothetical protein M3R57_06360 [Chloroflexota bacterium]|nr:hypothetical protein [Chloroflexota bacterium]
MSTRLRPLAALLCGALIATACGAQTPSSPSTGSNAPSVAPPGGPSGPAPSQEPGPPSSESLIAAALAAGTISYEDSLLYRALALYGSPDLPQEFQSPVPDIHVAMELFGEIDAKAADLSPALLEKLAPYRARPADPISIFNTPAAEAKGGIVLAVAVAAATPWRSRAVPGAGALVWVKDSPEADARLTARAAAVAKVWPQMPGIFTYPEPDQPDPTPGVNPDSAIDFYFVDAGALDPRRVVCTNHPEEPGCVLSTKHNGFTQRADLFHDPNKSSAYIVIDLAAKGDDLLDTVAHELAHGGQFAYDRGEASWLMESTATWAAFRVMKKLGLQPAYEYGFLEDFFSGLDQPLTRPGDQNFNSYASWLYFLFASMEEGDGIVTAIWQEAAAEGQQGPKAVDEAFAFDEHFDDFSVRDWNKDPVERQYKTADQTFPTAREPKLARSTSIGGAEEDLLDKKVVELSSAYYRYEFLDGVGKVIVENNYAGVDDAHVWAIKKIQGTWQKPEDWTNEVKKEFCRDMEDQDLGELILIVSNASMTTALNPPDQSKVVTKSGGCPGWSGTMTSTHSWNQLEGGVMHTGIATSTFTGIWQPDGPDATPVLPCSQAFPPAEPCIFYRPTGTIKWTWESDWPADDYQPGCHENTYGSLAAGDARFPDTQSLVLQPVDGDKFQYWGIGGVVTEPQNCPEPINNGTRPPQYFDILEHARSDAPPGGDGDTCFHADWLIEGAADTITGSCYQYKYDYNSLHFEWNLRRVGKAIPSG